MKNINVSKIKSMEYEEDMACEITEYIWDKIINLNTDINSKINILKIVADDINIMLKDIIKENGGEV